MKNFYVLMHAVLTTLALSALPQYPLQAMKKEETEGGERFTKKINYIGKTTKADSIKITDENTKTDYILKKDEVMSTIQESGKIRKEKQAHANKNSPLVPHKNIKLTANINGKKKTEEHPLYQINSKEDKRKARDKIQTLYEESRKGNKPEPLFLQMGPDETTDVNIIRSGLDIAVSPLRKSNKPEEGYLAEKPPAYGSGVDTSPQAFQKTLKLAEGARSKSAPVLRHIAKSDSDFIGRDKGGAKKLRNFDEGTVTKVDGEKVLHSVADIFISKIETKQGPSNIEEVKHLIKCELATETDSASFLLVNENSDKTEDYGYNEYIRPCEEGEFKENLIKLCKNDPNFIKFDMDISYDIYNGARDVEAVSWALSHNTVLEVLNCSFNNTRDEGAKALADMLKTNTTLLELNLTNNHIGWGVIDLADAMLVNTSLVYIDLSLNNKIWACRDEVESILISINRNRKSKNLLPLKSITEYQVRDDKTSIGENDPDIQRDDLTNDFEDRLQSILKDI